jgi:hypothetical protein
MPLVIISLRLKSAGLGLQLQRKFRSVARQTPAYADHIVNKACNSISFRAAQTMPVTSLAKIDSELGVITQGVTKKGRPSFAKKPKWVKMSFPPQGDADTDRSKPNWNFAVRITLARFYASSRYNVRTGQVWKLQKPPMRGQMAFWEWVYNTAERMVKARHKSIAFYKACAEAVNKGFGAVLGKVPVASGVGVHQSVTLLARGLAKVEPSRNGQGRAKFSVSDTEPDTKGRAGADFARRALPVWQKAVDAETSSIKTEVEKRLAENLRANGLLVP